MKKEPIPGKIKRHPDVAWRILEERLIAVTPHDSSIHRFNPTATFLWSLLEGTGKSRSELAEALSHHFNLDADKAGKDLDSFLNKAFRHQILIRP